MIMKIRYLVFFFLNKSRKTIYLPYIRTGYETILSAFLLKHMRMNNWFINIFYHIILCHENLE